MIQPQSPRLLIERAREHCKKCDEYMSCDHGTLVPELCDALERAMDALDDAEFWIRYSPTKSDKFFVVKRIHAILNGEKQ